MGYLSGIPEARLFPYPTRVWIVKAAASPLPGIDPVRVLCGGGGLGHHRSSQIMQPASSNFRMRIVLTGMAGLLLAASLSAREFHVATTGDDAKSGTLSAPLATVQRAEESVAPGDTVFIHGCTYRMATSQIARVRRKKAQVILLSKSGTSGRPIRCVAFGNEKPVFDFLM